MYLGLDVGGTHTDIVLLNENGMIASFKTATNHDDLTSSVREALEKIIERIGPDERKNEIRSVNLSTTLSTNAIIENRLEETGVIVSAGPGIDPENYRPGNHFFIIDGYLDHRRKSAAALDEKALNAAVQECRGRKLTTFAAVSRFSVRNPEYENQIKAALADFADFVSAGHLISSRLNFPRRISTAYYNSAVWRLYRRFADAIDSELRKVGIKAPINILKADGGTMPLDLSRDLPVETILSGPAASIMGIAALCDIAEDAIVLDIGGTTTDIAVFASGTPVISSPTSTRFFW